MNLYQTRFKPLGFASQSPIINLGKGKFIYAAHLNWHMAKTNCMSLSQVNIPFTNGKKQGIFTPCYAINLTFCKTKKGNQKMRQRQQFYQKPVISSLGCL